MTCGFLIQLVFCKKKMWFIGVEVEQETSAPPPEKNPGSAPAEYLGKKTLRGGARTNSKLNPWKKNCIASVIQTQVMLVGDKCLTTIPLLLPKMVPSTLV